MKQKSSTDMEQMNLMKNKETRGEYVLRMLKEQRAQQQNSLTLEDIHKELINLAQFVYKQRTSDLAFKGEVYHALRQLNIKLLTYRERHGYSMNDPS